MKRLFLLLTAFLTGLTVVGCTLGSSTKQTVQKILDEIEIDEEIYGPIDLPTELEGYLIEWTTDEPLVIKPDGSIYGYAEDHNAKLTATIAYGDGNTLSKNFNVIVKAYTNTTIENAWTGTYSKRISTKIIGNLELNKNEIMGCSVTYVSSDEEVMTSDGVINQKAYDQSVTLYAYVTRNKVTHIYENKITVLAFTNVQRINLTGDWLVSEVAKLQAGEIDILPTYNEVYNTYITWFGNQSKLISNNGHVIKPLTKQDVRISARIVLDSSSVIREFNLKDFGGDLTLEEQNERWIASCLPTRIHSVRNYLERIGDEDYLDYQIETNRKGVLNLIDGQPISINTDYFIDINNSDLVFQNRFFSGLHPSVSQAVLNDRFYDGYQLPNNKNILYIVCHETGMPGNGNNAEKLAKIQWNNAFVTVGARAASWNYQVDAYGIYQSFSDDVICWHAGDGTSPGTGNANGIGIEMCINQDGNYDGALYNNAKLVAHLMHKYNLKLENVQRHFDFSGKECPSYMIRTGRWNEFLELVDKEYQAMELLANATVTWTVTTSTNNDTASVLNEYFTKGDHTLWFSKPVSQEVVINLKMTVVLPNGKTIENTSTITLKPDKEEPEDK